MAARPARERALAEVVVARRFAPGLVVAVAARRALDLTAHPACLRAADHAVAVQAVGALVALDVALGPVAEMAVHGGAEAELGEPGLEHAHVVPAVSAVELAVAEARARGGRKEDQRRRR
jgi:hypothetical protein